MSNADLTKGNIPVAVIMCVYKNDTAEYLSLSISSIMKQEKVIPHLFIFVDGPLPITTSELLSSYANDTRVSIHYNDKNVGLASGLNWLLDNLVDLNFYDYIARMDADDISLEERLYKQVLRLSKNDVHVIGTNCYEINERGEQIFHKKMQASDIALKKNIIKRCPFIHPSVMFSSDVFRAGFRYNSSLMNTQDYYLWVELAHHGFIFGNVEEPLILFRVNETFHKRRGLKKAMNEFHGRCYAMSKLNVKSFKNVLYTLSYLALRLMPKVISASAYKYLR